MLKPGSIKLKESEAMLMEELKMFEDQEEKTLHNFEAESRSLSKYSLNFSKNQKLPILWTIFLAIYSSILAQFSTKSFLNQQKNSSEKYTY